jgi:hypothetical protein
VKAAQSELGTQILADFEEAFPSQGSKVNKLMCHLQTSQSFIHIDTSSCMLRLYRLYLMHYRIWKAITKIPAEL